MCKNLFCLSAVDCGGPAMRRFAKFNCGEGGGGNRGSVLKYTFMSSSLRNHGNKLGFAQYSKNVLLPCSTLSIQESLYWNRVMSIAVDL